MHARHAPTWPRSGKTRRDPRALGTSTKPLFFRTPDEFRAWLDANHGRHKDLLVGFYKVGSGHPSITWAESVDEALCVGWIDGKRQRIDDVSYTIRFSPRRRGSNWSAINIRRAKELEAEGRMRPAGRSAFDLRPRTKPAYSYEQRKTMKLDPVLEKRFRAAKRAWTFFNDQPPSLRHLTIFYVMSAKRDDTRVRRLESIIARYTKGQRIEPMAPTPKSA